MADEFAIAVFVRGRPEPIRGLVDPDEAREMILETPAETLELMFRPLAPPTRPQLADRLPLRMAFAVLLGERIRMSKNTTTLVFQGASTWGIRSSDVDMVEVTDLRELPDPRTREDHKPTEIGFRIHQAATTG